MSTASHLRRLLIKQVLDQHGGVLLGEARLTNSKLSKLVAAHSVDELRGFR